MGRTKSEKIMFNEYLDQIDSFNSNYTINGSTFLGLGLSYRKLSNRRRNQLIYKNVKSRLFNLLIKMYKWECPDSISPRTIEIGFAIFGAMCLFTSPVGDYMLPALPKNRLNVNGDPRQVNVFGWNGKQETVNIEYGTPIDFGITENDILAEEPFSNNGFKGIYCRDNDLTFPYINYIEQYAYSIADKVRALEIASQRLKSPFITVVKDKSLQDTFEKFIEMIENNEDLIVKIKSGKMENIKETIEFLQIAMNQAVNQALKDSILFDFNQFLETIGINTNPSPDKTQVVLTTELNSNNSLIDLEQDVRFNNREDLCKKAKTILGIDISVKKNTDELKEEIANTQKALAGDEGGSDVNIESKSKESK